MRFNMSDLIAVDLNKPIGQQLWDAIDTNEDGNITVDEIKTLMSKASADYKDADLTTIMDRYDFNKDDKISKAEFMFGSGTTDVNKANKNDFIAFYGQEEGSKLFDKYDKNEDGYVTKDEIISVDNSKGLSGWAIAGIVIGCVFVVGIIIAVIVGLSSEKKDKNNEEAENNLESLHQGQEL